MDPTQKHRNIYCIELMFNAGLCWHSAGTMAGSAVRSTRHFTGCLSLPEKASVKAPVTKTHEKPTAASCLYAVLHEAVKYRRAGLKSCRWWWGPGIRPLRRVSLSTYCSLFSFTHTLQLLLPRQHNVRFLQIMELWPLRHLVETSVASQYSPTL